MPAASPRRFTDPAALERAREKVARVDDQRQAALDLKVTAEELFPRKGRASPGGGFAQFCMKKIRYTLSTPGTPRAETEWDHGFSAADRAYVAALAKLENVATLKWNEISLEDRARLLAAFERLVHWLEVHAEFSIGADIEDYAEQLAGGRLP